jgi:hypothetical protein
MSARSLGGLAAAAAFLASSLWPMVCWAGPLDVERALADGAMTIPAETPQAVLYADLLRRASREQSGLAEAARSLIGRGDTEWSAAAIELLAWTTEAPEGSGVEAMLAWRLMRAANNRECDLFARYRNDLTELSPAFAGGVARAAARCGDAVGALVRITHIDTPTAVLARGEALIAAGDFDSAAIWCARAQTAGAGAPSIELPARQCRAIADVGRGVLPTARGQFLSASEAIAESPWLARRARFEAAIAATWASWNADQPARQPLSLANSLVRTRSEAEVVQALTTLLVAGNPPISPAEGTEGTLDSDQQLASWLRRYAAARARDQIDLFVDAASAAKQPALVLSAVRSLTQPDLVSAKLVELSQHQWLRSAGLLFDPVAWRRAVELWLDSALGPAAPVPAAIADRALSRYEWIRTRWSGQELALDQIPTADTVRRFLATADGTLLVYVIGERSTWVWRVEPTGGELVRLGPGDRWLEPSGEIFGKLDEGLRAGTELLIQPDGYLYGLIWSNLPPPPDQRGGRNLADVFDVIVAPSLRAICTPLGLTARDADSPLSLVVALSATSHDREPYATEWFDPVTIAILPGDAVAAQDGPAVLHIDVPLLAVDDRQGPLLDAGAGTWLRDAYLDHAPTFVTIAPTAASDIARASLVRAAAAAVDFGSAAAFVEVTDRSIARRTAWERLYRDLARGRENTDALRMIARGEAKEPGLGAHGIELVGRSSARLTDPRRSRWLFWSLIVLSIALTASALWRYLRRPRDRFEIEPPEEN